MTNEYHIRIEESAIAVFQLNKYEIAFASKFAVFMFNIITGAIQKICEAEDVHGVEKSGDYFLVSACGKDLLIHKNHIVSSFTDFALCCTISGKYILFQNNSYIELYDCEIGEIVDTCKNNPRRGQFYVQDGQIVSFEARGVRVFSVVGSKIHCSYVKLGKFIDYEYGGRAFYIRNGQLVVYNGGKIQSHPIQKIVRYGTLFDRITTENIDIKLNDSNYTIFDKSRAINFDCTSGSMKIMCGGKSINTRACSYSNDALAYYDGYLCLLNYKLDLFSMFWKYEKPELLKLRFEVAMQLRRILPCPIVKLIISECK